MIDIMPDNRTEDALTTLDKGEADDKLRDRVLVAMLRSQNQMLKELQEIKTNLWGIDRLEQTIDKRHQTLCANCPTKQLVLSLHPPSGASSQASTKKTWVELVLTSESLRYFLLMIILVWAIVYVKSGPEGVDSVHEGIVHTMTGGVK